MYELRTWHYVLEFGMDYQDIGLEYKSEAVSCAQESCYIVV